MKNEADFISKLLDANQQERAFKELLDSYQKRLYWHIRKMVITHENAADVLQNTFLRVYKSLPNFKQQSSLSTWMFKIAYNESLRFIEQNQKKTTLSIDNEANYLKTLIADSYFEGQKAQEMLHRVLAKLPEKERHIFQMKYFDDLKFREISEITGIHEGTLKTYYYKAVDFIEKNFQTVELLVIN